MFRMENQKQNQYKIIKINVTSTTGISKCLILSRVLYSLVFSLVIHLFVSARLHSWIRALNVSSQFTRRSPVLCITIFSIWNRKTSQPSAFHSSLEFKCIIVIPEIISPSETKTKQQIVWRFPLFTYSIQHQIQSHRTKDKKTNTK